MRNVASSEDERGLHRHVSVVTTDQSAAVSTLVENQQTQMEALTKVVKQYEEVIKTLHTELKDVKS